MEDDSKKGKRKGGRTAVSCLSCRARKLFCNLKAPCSSCIQRGEEAQCSLSNLLFYETVSERPAEQLKASVDRLESMVKRLRGSPSLGTSSFNRSRRSSQNSTSSSGSSPRLGRSCDNHDAETLTRFLIGPLDIASTGAHSRLKQELQLIEPVMLETSAPHLAEPVLSHLLSSTDTLETLYASMPTRDQAEKSIQYFFARVNHRLRLLHREEFNADCIAFWNATSPPDLHFLATYLAVCGNGLLAMTEEEAGACAASTEEGKSLLGRTWLDGSLQALSRGEFMTMPSVEGIRAIVLLNQFWAGFEGGRYLQAAVSFNVPVIAAAFELDLNRDPDELERSFGALEAENRRRIFYGLFTVDSLARSFLGTRFAPLDVDAISVRLPTALDDEAFTLDGGLSFSFPGATVSSNELSLVIALHSIVIILNKTSKLLFITRYADSEEILALHEELEMIHNSMMSVSDTTSLEPLLHYAFVRLHRMAFGNHAADLGIKSDWHRTMCLQHSDALLATFGASCLMGDLVDIFSSSASVSAAMTLAVDLLDASTFTDSEAVRNQLIIFISALDSYTWSFSSATVARRGALILRDLVKQYDMRSQASSNTTMAFTYLGASHSREGSFSSGNEVMIDTPPAAFLLPIPRYDHCGQFSQFHTPTPGDAFPSFAPSFMEASDYRYVRASGGLDYDVDESLPNPSLKTWLTSLKSDVAPVAEDASENGYEY